ncbi:IPT/TIG domain-containing protein [Prevotella sp. 10(H)]|uniref:IPT/TIG domain-containing protein n=1 Tax=Prevotella sp. 10(H) TaxID=1158294 RepID=UPI0004A77713|nr:IPT/TIG domain-containing protein [Prevotella sp. 10(H)]
MKRLNLKVLMGLLFIPFLIFSLVVSCSDDDKSSEGPHDPSRPIELTSFYPDSGGIATKVILNGANFGNDVSKIKVYFNEKVAPVVSSIGSKLYVITPKQPGDTCNISVVVGKDSMVYDKKFIYKIMTTVSTVCGKPGTKEVVVGTLGETELDNVTFLMTDEENNIFVSNRGEEGRKHKYLMVNEEQNLSTVIIPDVGSPPNQPGLLNDGKTIYIPNDGGRGYWTITSENMWKPRKHEMSGQNIDINYKHAFTMCYADGYMYTRAKNGRLIKMNPKTGESEVVDIIMSESDSYIQFSRKEPHMLYLTYTNQHCIYTYNINTKEHKLFAGIQGRSGALDGECLSAQFNEPRQMLFDEEDNMYLADTKNHTVRKITPEGIVSTVVGQPGKSGYADGNPEEALFNEPQGVTINKDGIIYVGDTKNNCIRKLAIE